jgi:hypothetical protein
VRIRRHCLQARVNPPSAGHLLAGKGFRERWFGAVWPRPSGDRLAGSDPARSGGMGRRRGLRCAAVPLVPGRAALGGRPADCSATGFGARSRVSSFRGAPSASHGSHGGAVDEENAFPGSGAAGQCDPRSRVRHGRLGKAPASHGGRGRHGAASRAPDGGRCPGL